jgi:electron transfer flavoprotein beta subunit
VQRLSAESLGIAVAASSVVVERIYLPERSKHTQLFEGSPKEAAAKLVEKLKFEARVI